MRNRVVAEARHPVCRNRHIDGPAPRCNRRSTSRPHRWTRSTALLGNPTSALTGKLASDGMAESGGQMSRPGGICILLPVLDEIDNIGPLLERIRAALSGQEHVICVVDDGSRDGTAEYIRRAMQVDGHRLH